MAEVIDMAAKEHQLRVRVLGHCAVWRGGVVCRRRHQCCLSAGKALTSALGHSTESVVTDHLLLYQSHFYRENNSFPTLPGELERPFLLPKGTLVLGAEMALPTMLSSLM